MDPRNFEESSNHLRNSITSNLKDIHQDGKTDSISNSPSNFLNSTANNTNPIVCAVCGSKEYITIHSQERGQEAGTSAGWNSAELPKKGSFLSEFGQSCGPLSLLNQPIFPHLSLLHFPNLYYTHYNSNMRFSSNPCIPIERYFGESNMNLGDSKTSSVDGESTAYREGKKKKNTSSINREFSLSKEESNMCKNGKDDSHLQSTFTNVSETRNYPSGMYPPWMGNICPVFPYTYAPLAFPLNQSFIPVYHPVPAKWQNTETRNDEGNVQKSVLNCSLGDTSSMKSEGEKQLSEIGETNQSDYDFEVIARELNLEPKTTYDEDDGEYEINMDEINMDEITSGLKLPQVDSRHETKSDKSHNANKKLVELQTEPSPEKEDDAQNWGLKTKINMQDCCIRPLSNENLWYDADGEKNWDSAHNLEYKCKEDDKDEQSEIAENNPKITAGPLYEEDRVGSQNQGGALDDLQINIRTNLKKSHRKPIGKPNVKPIATLDLPPSKGERNEEWASLEKSSSSEKVEYSEEKCAAVTTSAIIKDMKIFKKQPSKLDVQCHDFGNDKSCGSHDGEKIVLSRRDNPAENMQLNQTKNDQTHSNVDISEHMDEILNVKKLKISSAGPTDRDKEFLAKGSPELKSEPGDTKHSKSSNVIATGKLKLSLNRYQRPHADQSKKIDNKPSGLSLQRSSDQSSRIKTYEHKKFGYFARIEPVQTPTANSKIRKTDESKNRWQA